MPSTSVLPSSPTHAPSSTPITLLRLKRPRSPPPQTLHLQLPSSKRPRLSSLSLNSAHVSFHQLPTAPTITPQISVIDLTPSDLVHPPTRKRPAPTSIAPPPPATRPKPLESYSQQMTCNGVPMERQTSDSEHDEAWYIADNQRSDLGLAPLPESSAPSSNESASDSEDRVYIRMDSSLIPWLSYEERSNSDDPWDDDTESEGSVDYPSTPASSDNEYQEDDCDDDSEYSEDRRMPFGYHGMSTWPTNNHSSDSDDRAQNQAESDDEYGS